MAKIALPKNEGFTPIPEGITIFKITEQTYDEDFGKLEFTMLTESGKKHTEKFSLLKTDGEINEGAAKAFGFFARVALNDYDADEVDPEELVGRFLEARVEHDIQLNKNDETKTVTFVRLKDWKPSNGFKTESKTKKPSLNDLL